MPFPVQVEEFLQKIESYGKESLADIVHEIGEAVPMITRQSRFRLYLEDLTGGILSCVLATGRTLVETTRRSGARNMPDIAIALKACDPYSQGDDEQRRFYKFKNFLYKTVKV